MVKEEESSIERDCYGNRITDPFLIQQRREKRERMASMTEEQKAAEAAGVEVTRMKPVTERGKALAACGLPWVEADFEAEAEEKGVNPSELSAYAATMAAVEAERAPREAVAAAVEAVGRMRHEDMAKVLQAMVARGFDPGSQNRL